MSGKYVFLDGALFTDLANITDAAKGSGLVGYDPTLNYVVQTIGGALNDSRAEMMWFITDQTERSNIKASTSTTDHTTTIQAAMTLVGARELHFGDAGQWNISASLAPTAGATYSGNAKIRAINAAAITGAMLKGTTKTRVTVKGLEFDGNKANNGANYGVWFSGGSYNLVKDCYVHDTAQCGGLLEGETGSFVDGGQYLNCGQALTVTGGAATDNHGLMIISTSTTQQACGARNVRVDNAYRKGITTYTAVGGSSKYLQILGCEVSNCGNTPSSGGGIYFANQPTATDQDSAVISGNICWSNYTNFEIANVKRATGSANISLSSTAQGVVIDSCTDAVLPGFIISDSGADGLKLNDCANVAMGVVNIRRSNRSTAGFGPGLNLVNSTYCTFGAGSIVYDETPLQTHGIIEQGTCDYNDFTDITVVGATSALYTIVGANTRMRTRDGKFTGFGAITPLNTVHIDGGLSLTEQAITLANGANQNVALPAKAGQLVSNAPTGAYNIGGIAGGHAGRHLTLINYTGFAMTLNHQDAGSTAANRFTLASSANLVVPTLGSVELVYSAVMGAWTKVG